MRQLVRLCSKVDPGVGVVTTAADKALAKLPKTIRIGGFDFAIKPITHLEGYSEGIRGSFGKITQEIEIVRGMASVHKLVDTLFHEISHGFFYVYGVGPEDSEERIVSMLGTALLALHRDNSWLSRWVENTLRHG